VINMEGRDVTSTRDKDPAALEQQKPQTLWEIVTGLTRLYFTNPDLKALRETIGEQDYQHLLRINQKILDK